MYVLIHDSSSGLVLKLVLTAAIYQKLHRYIGCKTVNDV